MRFNDFWKGHLLLFERPLAPDHGDDIGWRFLVAFTILAFLVIPAFQFAASSSGLSGHEWSRLLLVVVFLAAFLLSMITYVRTDYSLIGLRKWSAWTGREKLYLIQTAPVCAVLFVILFQQHFRQLIESYGVVNFIVFSALTGLLWGATQEFIYRGLLQTELVRRFGAIGGVVASNLIFTVGPLHFNYFHYGTDTPVQWIMLATIFGVGLLFGVIYQRSGNLWIPAIFHGLWPLNMV